MLKEFKGSAAFGRIAGVAVRIRQTENPVRSLIRKGMTLIDHRRNAEDRAQAPVAPYVVKPLDAADKNALRVTHIIANFMTGGSSRLVVDLIENLGGNYKHNIITSHIPAPPHYVGLQIEECRFLTDEKTFIKLFKRRQTEIVHVHYWGDCDEPWYDQAISAARRLALPVIENINTPVAPYLSDAVVRYVYVSDYVRRVHGRNDMPQVTIYPGSDFSHFDRGDREEIPDDCVGMVYRLEPDKLNEQAIDPFIRIAQKRPQTRILIVGGGSLLAPFRQAVAAAGVADRFEFTGYVSYAALPELYRRMSLFVVPVWKESFGQVSPFAMNMRIPVIGYDIGALGEIIDDPRLLAPPADAEKLADIAIALLDSPDLREEIGRRQRQRAQQYFALPAMINAYADLYDEIGRNLASRNR